MLNNSEEQPKPEDILKKIQSRGYWLINVRPVNYMAHRFNSLLRCREVAEKSTVVLRGWDYPHSPRDGTVIGLDYVWGAVDWETHKEVWRLYQSGQFLHYLGLCEDWFDEAHWFGQTRQEIKPGNMLEVILTVLTFTEIYEYLSRLARLEERVFKDGAEIRITLCNTAKRELGVLDPYRMPFSRGYACSLEQVPYSRIFTEKQLQEENRKLAIDNAVEIFLRFQLTNPPLVVFQDTQQRLYEKRLRG